MIFNSLIFDCNHPSDQSKWLPKSIFSNSLSLMESSNPDATESPIEKSLLKSWDNDILPFISSLVSSLIDSTE